MNKIPRTIFAILVLGCLVGATEAAGLRPPNLLASSTLFLIGLAAPFGLLIWAFVLLEKEKILTRVALAIVFFFMLALCIVIARAPG